MTELRDSIDKIVNYQFRYTWEANIYLDPRSRNVHCLPVIYPWDKPLNARLGFDKLVMNVRPSAIPESVVAALLELEPLLQEILDCYVDSKFDGRNWRPIWRDEIEALTEKLERSEPPKIANFLDPGSWFKATIGDLKKKWAQGLSAEQIVDNVYLGNNINGRVRRDSAIFWLEDQFGEWDDELAKSSM